MKRLINIFFALLLPLAVMAQSVSSNADQLLRQFLQKLEAKTLCSAFTLTVSDDAASPITYNGKVKMRGERFCLSMLGNEGAYDGKTYYLYSEDTDELTLTTPTQAELMEANPLLFARELQRQSVAKFGSSGKRKDCYVVELIPNNLAAGIQKFVITIQKSTLLPLEVVVKERGAASTVLRFVDAVYEDQVPSFVITKPGAFVNDLR